MDCIKWKESSSHPSAIINTARNAHSDGIDPLHIGSGARNEDTDARSTVAGALLPIETDASGKTYVQLQTRREHHPIKAPSSSAPLAHILPAQQTHKTPPVVTPNRVNAIDVTDVQVITHPAKPTRRSERPLFKASDTTTQQYEAPPQLLSRDHVSSHLAEAGHLAVSAGLPSLSKIWPAGNLFRAENEEPSAFASAHGRPGAPTTHHSDGFSLVRANSKRPSSLANFPGGSLRMPPSSISNPNGMGNPPGRHNMHTGDDMSRGMLPHQDASSTMSPLNTVIGPRGFSIISKHIKD